MTDPLAVLQRIRESSPRAIPDAEEACELCAAQIAPDHGHMVNLEARSLMCVCRACYLLFISDGAGGAHFRSVPDRYLALQDLSLTSEQWDILQIPVSVAFFFVNSSIGRVAAFYPGPAGATESELSLEAWQDVSEGSAELATLQPDVEALLVWAQPHRAGVECYIVPIDACYELVGRLRRLWRGFDGGQEANSMLQSFFDNVRSRST